MGFKYLLLLLNAFLPVILRFRRFSQPPPRYDMQYTETGKDEVIFLGMRIVQEGNQLTTSVVETVQVWD